MVFKALSIHIARFYCQSGTGRGGLFARPKYQCSSQTFFIERGPWRAEGGGGVERLKILRYMIYTKPKSINAVDNLATLYSTCTLHKCKE